MKREKWERMIMDVRVRSCLHAANAGSMTVLWFHIRCKKNWSHDIMYYTIRMIGVRRGGGGGGGTYTRCSWWRWR
jgi:hypothetical protein